MKYVNIPAQHLLQSLSIHPSTFPASCLTRHFKHWLSRWNHRLCIIISMVNEHMECKWSCQNWVNLIELKPSNHDTHLTHTYWIRRALPAASMRMTGSSNSWMVTHAPAADTHIDVTMAAVCSQCWVVKPCCQSSRVPCSTWYTAPHTLQRRESGVEELFKN